MTARRPAEDPDGNLRGLYAQPPDEFVAARNALAKQLRAAGDRDAAKAVAGLRRPPWTDWALNAVAVEHPEAVAAYAGAVGDAREAQAAAIEGRRGTDVRTALGELREQTATVAARAAEVLASKGRPAERAELTARLSELAGDAAAVDQLTRSVLGSGVTGGAEPFGGLEPAERKPERPTEPRTTRRRKDPATTPSEKRKQQRPTESAEARRRRARELKAAERAHRDAEQALAEVDGELRAAARDVDTATEALAAAQTALEQSEQRRTALQDRRDELAAALADATTTLANLQP